MKPLVAALCLLLALPSHAEGEVEATPVQRAHLVLPDGTAKDTEGGCWLSERACIGAAQRIERLEAEAQAIPWVVAGLSFALGVAAGVWVATR